MSSPSLDARPSLASDAGADGPILTVRPTRRVAARAAARRAALTGWILLVPALAAYVGFVIWPLIQGVQYSFYDWNGIGVAEWVGLDNYATVFTDPALLGSIVNAFILILFFTVIPVTVGLVLATLIRSIRAGVFSSAAQTILFLPQIIPLAAAGIAWSWMYAQTGTINQILGWIGLGGITRSWLADYATALPAVGLIGSWVLTGLCTVLLLTGIGKIDTALYEAIRLDGAGWWREFFTITVPGLRQEIVVLVTLTVIAALSSFDIIYTSTQGGPGRATLVPGISIFRIGFTQSDVGLASAFGIVLMVLVLAVVLPIQRLSKAND
ncbi:carbohydrate ABC transporter membrane protein 1 (CUT1 family) [Labedella gwakjiensis]|uniref:Carbohydrate ABC transporter membrane protein 1 (CUT1 family) n=1 Tax=Labedella gwakjiensis TaxID=390269 RepID=A0A2P8GTL0_9MICO|nr:sugar ABC transporter permease [Labedella gwakjiensis]PSL37301.1 carbohydrate ABC transporter membrane protein 1 (CUT1 family) [Labedella gwakjiensis]RUQ84628.1 sugar ABC transporter permease [Labedella gwakjiensis]